MNKTAYYEISKSKFYSYFYEVHSLDEIEKIFDDLKSEHKRARHFCYAYILDDNGTKEKYSDDKEPKNTAGAPIMNVLKRKKLRDVLIVVVRYFGGTKLGAGGLVRAYTKATSLLFE